MRTILMLGSTSCLTVIEVAATWCLTRWAKQGNGLYCLAGLYLFAALGLGLGLTIRFAGHMNTINALWQSTSIVGVTLVSVYIFDEPITGVQILGVILASAASLCFL